MSIYNQEQSEEKEIQTLPTYFASAERASIEDIQQDSKMLSSNKTVQYLLNAVPNAFLILNEHRQIVFANQTFVDMVKSDKIRDILGSRFGEVIDCTHATETRGGCGTTPFCRQCGATRAIISSQRGKIADQECRLNTVDGHALDLAIHTKPFHYQGREYVVFTTRDIANEKRRQALERTFFHDLLNTAGVMSMYAQLIQVDPTEIDSISSELNRVSDRLINEINRYRDLVQAENHELNISSREINVALFLCDLVIEYRHHPVAKNKYIQIRSDLEEVNMMTDPVLLGRVLSNMIKNALEAVDTEETVTIWYEVNPDTEMINFHVHNPTHMPNNIQHQVFQRSFSTKGAGRGLGTYSMKLLSEQYLHGSVSFTSTYQQGTIFSASYPLELPLSITSTLEKKVIENL